VNEIGDKALVRRNKSRDAILERNLFSKFLYRSLNPPEQQVDDDRDASRSKFEDCIVSIRIFLLVTDYVHIGTTNNTALIILLFVVHRWSG
jgi:hypothetical protein